MMMKSVKFLAAAAILAAAVSCASIEKMAQMAENVKVTCDPGVLEAANDAIDAVVSVTYPADYFNPKAILEVTPVLVYEGGEAKMKPFIYQGEKVKDNYKVVSSDGQTVKEKIHFDYVPGMEKSHLELRGVARKGEKYVNLPAKKVADGVNTTYMLVKRDGFVTPKADREGLPRRHRPDQCRRAHQDHRHRDPRLRLPGRPGGQEQRARRQALRFRQQGP